MSVPNSENTVPNSEISILFAKVTIQAFKVLALVTKVRQTSGLETTLRSYPWKLQ